MLINKTLNTQLSEKKRKNSLIWATVNLCFASVVIFDLWTTKNYWREYWLLIECAACFILSLSFITNICTYIYYTIFTGKVVCENENQRILLNLSSNSINMKTQPQIHTPQQKQNDTINVGNLSYQTYNERKIAPCGNLSHIRINNFYSSFILANSTMTSSFNNSWMSNTSVQLKDSTFTVNPEVSFVEASNFQTPSKFKNSEFIMNRSTMDQYLKNVSQQEKEIASAIESQNNMTGYIGTNFNTFWGNCRFDEIIASLKTSFYQLSPHNNKQNSQNETYSSKDQENNSEIIRMMCANKLSNYTANLKMVRILKFLLSFSNNCNIHSQWISRTILEPLVFAIDETDKAFQQRGFTDMKIGNVGLERLKKMSSTNQHLIQHIPMLPKLIPFLELTTNQEYMVQRIRELAKGSCMKLYKFNLVTFSQPDQADHIPSDAGIIFHLFCTYLDSQLHPLPDVPRAFFSRYVVVGDAKKITTDYIIKEMNKNKAKCGILCSNPITPKFNFISDKVHTSSYDRNNLFYVIIQFLMHLKGDGMLESVNLGKSGINILNIIQD